MNEREACMVSRSAGLFSGGGGALSLFGSANVQTDVLQLLEEEKVQQLYLNWGSVNWLTHGLI